jgi:hypothetical protein
MIFLFSPEGKAVRRLPECYLKLIGARVNEYLIDDNHDWLGRGESKKITSVSRVDKEGNFFFYFTTFDGIAKSNSCKLNVKKVNNSIVFSDGVNKITVREHATEESLIDVVRMAMNT